MYTLTSKHRSSLMGISALIIVIHHYFTAVLNKPYKFGAIGVDFFMFTMGLGLYFSLYSAEEKDNTTFSKILPSFYWRRFKRIIPVLAVFLVFWGMWKHSNGGFGIKEYFLNLSLTGYWTLRYGYYFNWFVSALLFFYFLTPLFYIAIKKSKNKIVITSILFVLVSVLVFYLRKDENGTIHRTLIMVVRIIPFIFGMLFGSLCKEPPSKKEKNVYYVLFTILFVIGAILYYKNNTLWNDAGFTYGMPWYSLGLMTPFLCVLLCYIIDLLSRFFKSITKIFDFFGEMSFELYLTHIFIIENIMQPLSVTDNKWFPEPLNFIACVFVSVLFAYLLLLFKNRAVKANQK